MDVDEEEDVDQVNLANALNLDDSEEEEEMEDIIDDFSHGIYTNNVGTSFRYVHPSSDYVLERRTWTRTTILLPVPRTLPCLPVPSCATRR